MGRGKCRMGRECIMIGVLVDTLRNKSHYITGISSSTIVGVSRKVDLSLFYVASRDSWFTPQA